MANWLAVEDLNGIVLVRFDRPPANALDLEAIEEIGETLARLANAKAPRGIVLTGRGEFFSAGLDLKSIAQYSRKDRRQLVERINSMAARVYSLPIPLVAAVNGHAVAGGLVLALLCDLRVGARGRARMGFAEARVGIPFPAGSLEVIRAELGTSMMRRLILTSRTLEPSEAHSVGILDAVVDPDDLLSAASALARAASSAGAAAYGAIKTQLRGSTITRLQNISNRPDPLGERWLESRG